MTETVARDTQAEADTRIAAAIRVVRELLGDRDASKVDVHVTPRGFRITAETAEGSAVKKTHEWKP
jgi:hypothetical protein